MNYRIEQLNLGVDPGLVSDPVRKVFSHQDVDPAHSPAVQAVLQDTLNPEVLEIRLEHYPHTTTTLGLVLIVLQ